MSDTSEKFYTQVQHDIQTLVIEHRGLKHALDSVSREKVQALALIDAVLMVGEDASVLRACLQKVQAILRGDKS